MNASRHDSFIHSTGFPFSLSVCMYSVRKLAVRLQSSLSWAVHQNYPMSALRFVPPRNWKESSEPDPKLKWGPRRRRCRSGTDSTTWLSLDDGSALRSRCASPFALHGINANALALLHASYEDNCAPLPSLLRSRSWLESLFTKAGLDLG